MDQKGFCLEDLVLMNCFSLFEAAMYFFTSIILPALKTGITGYAGRLSITIIAFRSAVELPMPMD